MNAIKNYLILARFDKPIGILLLLWPTLWALWIAAQGMPRLSILMVFVLGVIIMRASGCIINDIADRNLDAHVARTQNRPMATGAISTPQALIAFGLLTVCAFALVLTLNYFTILLSLPAVALAISYPFMKRFTHFPQAVLGIAFSWSIFMAFAAQANHIPWITWPLFLSGALWTIIYDTEYAMVDRDDDIRMGMKSTAIVFGQYDRLIIGILQIIVVALWCYCGALLHAGFEFFIAVGIAAALFCYQQYWIRNRVPGLCFKAFLNNNWIGMIIFIGVLSCF